jgi:hypothetical protein
MRIRALVHIAGNGFHLGPGDETDQFTEADAMRLVAKNAAVLVVAGPKVERMVEEPVALETRDELQPVKRGGKGKRG